MRTSFPCFLLLLLAVVPARSQFSYPASASTRLDFAQLADGGAPVQKWTTTIAVANPDPTTAATVTLTFYADSGQLLPLDFGQGVQSMLTLNVPGGGSRIVTSTETSSTTAFVTGWARAISNIPVYGTVIYRATSNGVPVWDVAAAGTGPTYFYSSQAKYTLGVALANPSTTDAIHLRLSTKDQDGTAGSNYDVPLPPNGHTSFVLGAGKGIVPMGFTGTVAITTTDTPPAPFLAWTLYERDGLLSPLPAGATQAPAPYGRRPQDALTLVQVASTALVKALGQDLYDSPPDTVAQYIANKGLVLEEEEALKATYKASDDSVHLSHLMVESLGSSEAGLAFVIGHYVARGVLARTGLPDTGIGASSSIQTAADALALAAMLTVGYDPGGMADFLGRLSNAQAQGLTIDFDLLSEFGPLEETGARLTKIWSKVMQGCTDTPQLSTICKKAHDYWHQHYPTKVP